MTISFPGGNMDSLLVTGTGVDSADFPSSFMFNLSGRYPGSNTFMYVYKQAGPSYINYSAQLFYDYDNDFIRYENSVYFTLNNLGNQSISLASGK